MIATKSYALTTIGLLLALGLAALTLNSQADGDLSRVRSTPDLILSMSRSILVCDRLSALFPGIPCVNSSRAACATLRYSLYPLLIEGGFSFPETKEVDIESMGKPVFPFWLKRRDYHHLKKGDVCFVEDESALKKALDFFKSQDEKTVFFQKNISGERFKFYAIRDLDTFQFRFFAFRKTPPAGVEAELKAGLEGLMLSMGLEIFGGDFILTSEGEIFLVDVNAWPSFKGFQKEAAEIIAEYCREVVNR